MRPNSCWRMESGAMRHYQVFSATLSSMKRLEGKTAVITGAASGIGRATSLLFAQEGANVVVLHRAPAVEETAAMIRQNGGKALAFVKDSTEEAADAEAL